MTFKIKGGKRKANLCINQVTLLISAKEMRWDTGTVFADLPGTYDTV